MAEMESLPVVTLYLEDHFFGDSNPSPIESQRWQSWFARWLKDLGGKLPEAVGYELSLRLTGDRAIQTFNAQYRQKDQPTDVLAFAALESEFPYSSPLDSEPLYLGDLIISVETAQRQAQQQSHPLTTELVWLASHGFLHLLGWDHPDEESLLRMLSQQKKCLEKVGFVITDL
ncbi:rRNA maturation RNase YbeY [Spirulina subsalsa]|uniref:rRNA maturation RNase YbeY n=1 Tax=Spirulina subsalsa TaxID=54311 RepID=UPI00037ED6FE|nr:rRNA maturation RNase YbeY [Spirulina subsalsa]